jgi:cysteinyl-tRNA synthetase
MNDDFNTAGAVAELFSLAADLNKSKSPQVAEQLRALGGVLGLLQQDADTYLQSVAGITDDGEAQRIQTLVDERTAAKKARQFAEADRLRANLLAQGIVLEDGPGGTTWRRQ